MDDEDTVVETGDYDDNAADPWLLWQDTGGEG